MGGIEDTKEGRVGSTWEGEERLPRESLAKSYKRNKNFIGKKETKSILDKRNSK